MTVGRLVTRVGLLATLTAATLTIVFFIPASSRTSFTEAIIDKQKRLEELPPGKVILTGGSNLAFGIDSYLIEQELGRPVVNMGLTGAVGIPFMLAQVKIHVAPGDLIVLSPEYELFFETPMSSAVCLNALYLRQPWRYVGYIGYGRCAVTTLGETLQHKFKWSLRKIIPLPDVPLDPVYARKSFNQWGDVDAHVSRLPKKLPKGPGRIEGEPTTAVIDAINEFAHFASNRGARVILIYPACAESIYAPHLRALTALDHRLRLALAADVVFASTPEEFFFPQSMIFDTEYHLTGTGRALRSQRVAEALQHLPNK